MGPPAAGGGVPIPGSRPDCSHPSRRRRPAPTGRAPARPLLVLALLLALSGCEDPTGAPRSWECIAPAAAGGGWDLTCRAASSAAQELGLSPGTMRVTNLPGAGGGIAFAHAVAQRDGDEGVLVAASPATTLRLAQGQFAHLTEEDVRWIAAIGADYGVVAVSPDAPWDTLEELLAEWRPDPTRFVVAGGSAVAGLDHMKMLVLGDAAGVDPLRIRYVPFDGGGEALTALLGGFVQLLSTDASQVIPHLEAGTLKVLAVLAPQRAGGVLAGIPTAHEAGYDVEWITWRGFYAPRGISEEAYQRWVAVLTEVEQSEAWGRVRQASGLDPLFVAGADFEAFVRDQVTEYREMSREIGLIQ
jgi:putative tricarboxylic transport membrane protein